jgi:hypothetical protein
VRRFFRAKAQRFGANGSDACGCCNPLGGVVVVTFFVPGLRVKTLDCGLDDGGVMRRYPLGGVVVEPRVISVPGVFGSIRFSVVFLLIFDLLCFVKRISSSPCISLAVVALFIKRGESLFREN